MMKEFDQFHPTVKDVEANAERESGERIEKILKPRSRFCSFREIWSSQIGEADDEEKKFASLMAKYWNHYLEEHWIFLLPKDLGEYKGEEVQVSNGRYGPIVMELLCFAKRRKTLDVDFERAELIDEKAIADDNCLIKEKEVKGTGRLVSSNGMDCYQCE
jgi:DNA topoisomerase-1